MIQLKYLPSGEKPLAIKGTVGLIRDTVGEDDSRILEDVYSTRGTTVEMRLIILALAINLEADIDIVATSSRGVSLNVSDHLPARTRGEDFDASIDPGLAHSDSVGMGCVEAFCAKPASLQVNSIGLLQLTP